MSKIDLIYAYLEKEMSESERHAFEESLQKDPELKQEFNFQQDVIDGIKEARRMELKAMLDKVPVGAGSSGGITSYGKVALTTAFIGLAGYGLYYYLNQNDKTGSTQEYTETQITQEIVEPSENSPNEITAESTPEKAEEPVITREKSNPAIVEAQNEEIVTEENNQQVISEPEINTPNIISAFDSVHDMTDSLEAPGGNLISKSVENPNTTLDVSIDNSNKDYTFHYQFKKGRLFLYGSFDNDLYEILEINSGSSKTVFLYYNGQYYQLARNQDTISPLDAVTDTSLIEKLKKIREDN